MSANSQKVDELQVHMDQCGIFTEYLVRQLLSLAAWPEQEPQTLWSVEMMKSLSVLNLRK